MNLGQIELAAIRGVEQGFTQLKMLDVKTQSDAATESLSKADDIGEFQIEGISIGRSLLEFGSENEIKVHILWDNRTMQKLKNLKIYCLFGENIFKQ